MNYDKMLEEFKAWASAEGFYIHMEEQFGVKVFLNQLTAAAWLAWSHCKSFPSEDGAIYA